jgi:predicted Zn-dependent protease
MAGFLYQLGKLLGPKVRKAKWVLRSLTGTEAEAIQAEFEVGRDLAQAVAREMEREQDPDVSRLLSDVGGRLASRVKNKHRRFVFSAVGAAEANAFALPGGFIWVTRPLLELCGSNPDEVAFILGHEMGHVICKHAMDRLMANSVLDTALRVVPIGGLVGSQVGGFVLSLLKQRYSQDQELEADQLGVRLARSAGFEPAAAIRLLDRLKQKSGEDQAIAEYFSSHPPFDLRIANLRQLLNKKSCETDAAHQGATA